ncbi:MAG: ABC transporter ATP-binding protein [Geodermatophilaceae bacterium]|nr:ABC transporter ATP-binding protein [Geodermatophilaceae bacterium]
MSQPSASPPALLTMAGIDKSFGSVRALIDVDFEVAAGEVHGLVGGNGAGKTTLMNVLYGLYRPDAGSIAFNGSPLHARTPKEAIAAGIGMVHQNLLQVTAYSVSENIVLGMSGGGGRRAEQARIAGLSDRFGLAVDPRARTGDLSVGARQRVEILKVLYRGARLLILDEPTTNLTPQEVDGLFASLDVIVAEGTSVVFISHKVREVLAACQRISVMRDGSALATVERSSVDADGLATLMVGDLAVEQAGEAVAALGLAPLGEAEAPAESGPAPASRPKAQSTTSGSGQARLQVRDLVSHNDHGLPAVRDVSLDVASGEVVGIAGVAGNGQVELAEALTGVRPIRSGSVQVEGVELSDKRTAAWLRAGVAYVPEDRHRDGVCGAASVTDNLLLGSQRLDKYKRSGLIAWRRVRDDADRAIEAYSIRTPSASHQAGMLSGGNIQRVVLARAFSREPTFLLLHNATRGLDLRSTQFVYDRVHEARDRGCAVLVISEDLDELSLITERFYVLYDGKTVGEHPSDDYDPYEVGRLMSGVGQAVDRS